MKPDRPSYLVLKGTYGQKFSEAFGMSRQGVRWRFQRALSNVYVSAFETILYIERILGPDLREHAIRISRERYELRQKWAENGPLSTKLPEARRQTIHETGESHDSQL
ncbi:MAG: hypothetical protein IPK83_16995 [Planctomycetes bacterium]|nr:hypothetical protein [Planctomycetota bacterium]